MRARHARPGRPRTGSRRADVQRVVHARAQAAALHHSSIRDAPHVKLRALLHVSPRPRNDTHVLRHILQNYIRAGAADALVCSSTVAACSSSCNTQRRKSRLGRARGSARLAALAASGDVAAANSQACRREAQLLYVHRLRIAAHTEVCCSSRTLLCLLPPGRNKRFTRTSARSSRAPARASLLRQSYLTVHRSYTQ